MDIYHLVKYLFKKTLNYKVNSMESDYVDTVLAQWVAARPDLDCAAMGIAGRLKRTSAAWGKKMDATFKLHDMNSIDFDILATLRRTAVDVTPTELYQTLMLSSGAMSTKIEQLVKRDLVSRVASDEDRRSCKLKLTPLGVEVIDAALDYHVANLDRLTGVLNHKEQEQLAGLLRKILIAETE